MQATIERQRIEQKYQSEVYFDELISYNAAFHELGLPWQWDATIYAGVVRDGLRRYIGDHHPHLLKAYDADFLIAAIETTRRQFLA